MSTPYVVMTKARIAAFLAKVKAHKAARPSAPRDLEQIFPTTIRYQRMGAGQEQRV